MKYSHNIQPTGWDDLPESTQVFINKVANGVDLGLPGAIIRAEHEIERITRDLDSGVYGDNHKLTMYLTAELSAYRHMLGQRTLG